jgi:hypothetical protein
LLFQTHRDQRALGVVVVLVLGHLCYHPRRSNWGSLFLNRTTKNFVSP